MVLGREGHYVAMQVVYTWFCGFQTVCCVARSGVPWNFEGPYAFLYSLIEKYVFLFTGIAP